MVGSLLGYALKKDMPGYDRFIVNLLNFCLEKNKYKTWYCQGLQWKGPTLPIALVNWNKKEAIFGGFYARLGSLLKYSEGFYGDWTLMRASSRNVVESEEHIFICAACIDSAFWMIFGTDFDAIEEFASETGAEPMDNPTLQYYSGALLSSLPRVQ